MKDRALHRLKLSSEPKKSFLVDGKIDSSPSLEVVGEPPSCFRGESSASKQPTVKTTKARRIHRGVAGCCKH
jgi:hypothetical protein